MSAEAKREALWHYVQARLEEVVQALDLPVLEEPRLMEALDAGYLAALEDFAPPAIHALIAHGDGVEALQEQIRGDLFLYGEENSGLDGKHGAQGVQALDGGGGEDGGRA